MDYEPLIVLEKPSCKASVPLHRDQLVGLHALIHWLKGYEAHGQGRVPGAFELMMHYRGIRSALTAAASNEEPRTDDRPIA